MTAGHGPSAERPVVVGLVNSDLRIKQISATVRELLGHDPAHCVGAPAMTAVHPDDLPASLLGVAQALESTSSVDLRVRLRHRERRWSATSVVLVAFAQERAPSLGFVATPSPATADGGTSTGVEERLATLEGLVRRIAFEVRSVTSTAPDRPPVPDADVRLTSRELEILDLLMSGQRVPGIARTIFVSQSTVRNHLCSIYRKLAVHSQQELLELMQSGPGSVGRDARPWSQPRTAEAPGTGRGRSRGT